VMGVILEASGKCPEARTMKKVALGSGHPVFHA
jgi:hypothetical protein